MPEDIGRAYDGECAEEPGSDGPGLCSSHIESKCEKAYRHMEDFSGDFVFVNEIAVVPM